MDRLYGKPKSAINMNLREEKLADLEEKIIGMG
jgi:hypothetical protein